MKLTEWPTGSILGESWGGVRGEGCGGSVVLLLCQRESKDCPFLYCHVPASCVKVSTNTEFEP